MIAASLASSGSSAGQVLWVGDFQFDEALNELRRSDQRIALSPLAARLLTKLAAEPRTVTRAELIDALWAGNFLVGDPALNRLVSELRAAVGDSPRAPSMIQTVPKVGYRLVATVRRTAPDAKPMRAWGRPLLTAACLLLAAVVVYVLVENIIGLIWVLRHPG